MSSAPSALPISYGSDAPLGRTTPRLWTPPLVDGAPGPCGCGCALTEDTSDGFDVAWFAEHVLAEPLDPWERWLAIHALEVLPDGRPRFRTVLAIVARQQGKSHLLRVIILFWLFITKLPTILGTSTDRSYAKAFWRTVVDTAKACPPLAAELPARPTVEQLGDEEFRTIHGTRYRFAANNRRAGRSLTLHRLVVDEIREHANWDTWNAASFAMNAVPGGQAFCVSNQGDDNSTVLDGLRDGALAFIETGVGDPRTGLFEWSVPPGSDPTDLNALAYSCPNLGRRTDPDTLLGAARRAKAAGGDELAGFRTEVMCERVSRLDPAIDPDAWKAAAADEPLDLAQHRDRVALCADISLDGLHATLIAAALIDGLVHVEVVAAWSGPASTTALRAELPDLVRKVKPRTFGWFPAGPAAAVAAELGERKGRRDWPPRRVEVEEIRGDAVAVCMGLADIVRAGEISHPADPVLDVHVKTAEKQNRGDGWVFTRRGSGQIDGAYALAGAVHLARTLRPAPPPLAAL